MPDDPTAVDETPADETGGEESGEREKALQEYLAARAEESSGGGDAFFDPLGEGASAEPHDEVPADDNAGETADDQTADAKAKGSADVDGDGPGKGADDTKDKLPVGVRNRLKRARKQVERVSGDLDAARKRIAELEAQQTSGAGTQGDQTGQSAQEEPDAPLPSDYATHQAYTDDLDAWMDGRYADMKGGNAPSGTKATPKAPPPKSADTGQPDTQSDPQAERQRMIDDIRDAVESQSGDDAEDDLMDDLLELGQRGRIVVTEAMLRHMADMDDADVHRVVAHFVERPAAANRISRQAASRQKKALDELTKRLSTKAGSPSNRAEKRGFEGAKPLRGDAKTNGVIDNTDDYLALRKKQDELSPREFGLSY